MQNSQSVAANITAPRASESGQLDLALATAEDGYPVHPVGMINGTKKPLTPHGFKDATTDAAQIIEWWTRYPLALVSVPTGIETGLAVLDIDLGGEPAFGQLMARLGLETEDDLSHVRSITPSGGRHYYFEYQPGTSPRTRASDIAPNIDSRGLGGSIIIPEPRGTLRRPREAFRERVPFDPDGCGSSERIACETWPGVGCHNHPQRHQPGRQRSFAASQPSLSLGQGGRMSARKTAAENFLQPVTPHDDPVEGELLLEAIREAVTRFMVLVGTVA